jgi:hypothetical protein
MLPLPLGLFERGELGIGKYDEKKDIGKRYVHVKTNKTHQICLTAYTPINKACRADVPAEPTTLLIDNYIVQLLFRNKKGSKLQRRGKE